MRTSNQSRRVRRQELRSQFSLEPLEARSMMATVHFTIDPQQNVKPISQYIYGVNEALQGRTKPFIDLFRFLQAAGVISLEELDDSSPLYFPTNVTVRIVRPDGTQEALNARDRPKTLPGARGPKKEEPPR